MINYYCSLEIMFNVITKQKFFFRSSSKNISINNNFFCVMFFDLISFKNSPNFCNSAMDGYAFNFLNVKYNSSYVFNRFFIIDIAKAGCSNSNFVYDGDYVLEIMTGSNIPVFFDSILKLEDIFLDFNNPFEIIIKREFFYGENIRKISDDFFIGENILKKGDIFSLNFLPIISSLGLQSFSYLDFFNVHLFCTGNEILDVGFLNIYDDFIFNNIRDYFLYFFDLLNIKIFYHGIILDEKKKIKEKILSLLSKNEINIIITTGGVSKGKADFIPSVLTELGFFICFHGVSIRPGKPILFAFYEKNYFFCLPGNPISSIIGIRFFLYPFIRYLCGLFFENPFFSVLIENYFNNLSVDYFLKSFVYFFNSNFYSIILINQYSFNISSLTRSNSFIFIKASSFLKKGDNVITYFCKPIF